MAEPRRRTEDKIRAMVPIPEGLSMEDARSVVHELHIHQVELEMQNAELLRIQSELEDSRSKYSDLYDFAPLGYLTLNNRGLILEANLTASRQLALERKLLISKPFTAFMDEKDAGLFYLHIRDLFEHNKTKPLDIKLKTKNGDRFLARLDSIMAATVKGNRLCRTSVIDITEQKTLEDQLRQAQKMEAVGQLTGGIAHDFNNILAAIMGYGYILKKKTAKDDPMGSYIDQIIAASEKAASLIQSLLSFSRNKMMDVRTVDLNEMVARAEDLLERILRDDITLKTMLTTDDTFIEADAGLIEQVLVNLATNSRDAMPDGGEITIETGSIELTEEFVTSHGFGKPGKYVMLAVSDTGRGMDEITRKRVFEPFFTTKGIGKGSGLGLSMVYGTIKQLDGYIDVRSEPHAGTICTIYLPLAKSNKSDHTVRKKKNKPIAVSGTETLLIAEDNVAARQSLTLILREHGYSVIESSNGWEAIEKFIENREKIKLLVLDMIMPKKSGKHAYEEIMKICPGIRTIFLSGYAQDRISGGGTVQEDIMFMLKPVAPEVLLRKIRDLLDR